MKKLAIVLFVALIIATAAKALAVETSAVCPYDGEYAFLTSQKPMIGGGTACQYSHTHFQNGASVRHSFWVNHCE